MREPKHVPTEPCPQGDDPVGGSASAAAHEAFVMGALVCWAAAATAGRVRTFKVSYDSGRGGCGVGGGMWTIRLRDAGWSLEHSEPTLRETWGELHRFAPERLTTD